MTKCSENQIATTVGDVFLVSAMAGVSLLGGERLLMGGHLNGLMFRVS